MLEGRTKSLTIDGNIIDLVLLNEQVSVDSEPKYLCLCSINGNDSYMLDLASTSVEFIGERGLYGQFYDGIKNMLFLVVEGVVLECALPFQSKMETLGYRKDRYSADYFWSNRTGPFIKSVQLADLADRLISVSSEPDRSPGIVVDRGAVEFRDGATVYLSEEVLLRERGIQLSDSSFSQGTAIVDPSHEYAVPYEIKLSEQATSAFVRKLVFEAARVFIEDRISGLEEGFHSYTRDVSLALDRLSAFYDGGLHQYFARLDMNAIREKVYQAVKHGGQSMTDFYQSKSATAQI